MRLKFAAKEWMHVLLAVRIAQKVLTSGEYKDSTWDPKTGRQMEDELMALIRRNPNHPQVATKIDLSHLGPMDDTPKDAPLVASSASPAGSPETEKRLKELETRVIALMQGGETKAPEGEDPRVAKVLDQNLKIFEFLGRLEDRIMALERRRK